MTTVDTLARETPVARKGLTRLVGLELMLTECLIQNTPTCCLQTGSVFAGLEGSTVLSRDDMKKMHPALADIYDAGCNVRCGSGV